MKPNQPTNLSSIILKEQSIDADGYGEATHLYIKIPFLNKSIYSFLI